MQEVLTNVFSGGKGRSKVIFYRLGKGLGGYTGIPIFINWEELFLFDFICQSKWQAAIFFRMLFSANFARAIQPILNFAR
ncbi:hypothetical protein IX307_001236 [Bacteroides pyogenes]|nr:hypothetical protein [Bacteroides pyogenes]MBR8792415.1 hypothetical protein [Bacteroides pyogenes]